MANESLSAPRLPTVSQTVGPFFHIGLRWLFDERVVRDDAPGRHIVVQGKVLDGDGSPIPDALIEIWQADSNGTYSHPHEAHEKPVSPGFRGYARVPTSDEGRFRLYTVKPGRVPAPGGGMQAPHVLVALFMRGLLRQLITRIYFSDEPSNDEDFVLLHVPALRRATLVATCTDAQPEIFEWNIVLQGPHETVFLDL